MKDLELHTILNPCIKSVNNFLFIVFVWRAVIILLTDYFCYVLTYYQDESQFYRKIELADTKIKYQTVLIWKVLSG